MSKLPALTPRQIGTILGDAESLPAQTESIPFRHWEHLLNEIARKQKQCAANVASDLAKSEFEGHNISILLQELASWAYSNGFRDGLDRARKTGGVE